MTLILLGEDTRLKSRWAIQLSH